MVYPGLQEALIWPIRQTFWSEDITEETCLMLDASIFLGCLLVQSNSSLGEWDLYKWGGRVPSIISSLSLTG